MKTLLRSFAAGEIAPELFGRVDLAKNQTGCADLTNFIALPHGPAANRGGLRFIAPTKYHSLPSRLIPFSYNTEQTYWLEFGHQYVRFHTQGATLLSAALTITGITQAATGVVTIAGHGLENDRAVKLGTIAGMTALSDRWVVVKNKTTNTFELYDILGRPIDTSAMPAFVSGTAAPVYEVATPYDSADVFGLGYAQSNDILTLVSNLYETRTLRRLSAASWTLVTEVFEPSVAAPTANPVLSRIGTGGAIEYQYKITALTEDDEESGASPVGVWSPTYTFTITGITQANPGVFTFSGAHGRTADQSMYVSGVGGMPIPDGEYLINSVPTSTTMTLKRLDGTLLDTSALAAWTSGGTVTWAAVSNNLATAGNTNVITWTAITGAARYNIYKNSNGIYGYVGQTPGIRFVDDNITADISKTPPEGESPFEGAGNYPRAVGYFDGRKWFAGTDNAPQTFWATRSGTEANMQYSRPTRADDRINYKLNAQQSNAIRHIVPQADVLLLTSGGEWRLQAQNSDVLTPSNISPRAQAYVGASSVRPVTTKVATLYAQDRGGRIMSLEYDDGRGGYVPDDKSVMAPHLFDYDFRVVDMAFSRAPVPILWAVRDDGVLLGMTYLPEHDIYAWHKHATAGTFESTAVAASGIDDAAYFIVKRNIDGVDVRYVEHLTPRRFVGVEDAFFVDSGLTYEGAAATTIGGLWHLVGESVVILADGGVLPAQTVSAAGTVTLPQAASVAHIGLLYASDMVTLPLAAEVEAAFQGTRKNINKVYLRLSRSSGVFAGPSEGALTELKQRSTEPMGSPPALIDGIRELPIRGSWEDEGQVRVRQTAPLPLMVSALVLEVTAGG